MTYLADLDLWNVSTIAATNGTFNADNFTAFSIKTNDGIKDLTDTLCKRLVELERLKKNRAKLERREKKREVGTSWRRNEKRNDGRRNVKNDGEETCEAGIPVREKNKIQGRIDRCQ
jgi:chromatin segregation and condensation protein Rec8/ScpA/Scc1 (kleisin family)